MENYHFCFVTGILEQVVQVVHRWSQAFAREQVSRFVVVGILEKCNYICIEKHSSLWIEQLLAYSFEWYNSHSLKVTKLYNLVL